MCNPVAWQVGIALVGAGLQIQAQRQKGRFDKGVADYNARVAENEAQATLNTGTEAENIKRQETAELLAKQRAQLGAANVDLNSGSAFQLQEDTVSLGEADALRIRSNFGDRASALDASAGLTSRQGDYANQAGQNAAFGTLLGGAGDVIDTGVADKWFTPNSSANTSGFANA